jgi:hypothetical protein
MKESAFRYGESNRGFGMIALPETVGEAPIVVMLNAGLLHREEPYRLNVLTCRRLAENGYICLRVDISGKGDTPARKGLINRDSVALDWQYIKSALKLQYGERNIIIMGLCSGADNGIKIAAQDRSVIGLILLDAVSKRDRGFRRRALMNNIANAHKWFELPKKILNRIKRAATGKDEMIANAIALRDEPNDQDLKQCFNNLVSSSGRVLAVFTSHALTHYNQKGQFSRAMEVKGLEKICDEVFWPNVQHLYPVQAHRDLLISTISDWCIKYYDRFISTKESV